MENSHQYTKAIPTVDSKDWPKTLKAFEEYTHVLCRVYNVPSKYVSREKIKPKDVVHGPEVGGNVSYYPTYDE